VVRFASRERHTVFLEPEGLNSPLVYPAGLSTSLPEEVQLDFLRTIVGLESAEVAQPGYAVEYDFVPATQLAASLGVGETGLFLAGQINGTSGYEEAAAQGLWAGVSAAQRVLGRAPLGLVREDAHLAVLVDELTTKPTAEPFRMFTSRSENRLALREGNADLRLSELGASLGLLSETQRDAIRSRRDRIAAELARLESTTLRPDAGTLAEAAEHGLAAFEKPASLRTLLARPEVGWAQLNRLRPSPLGLPDEDWAEVEAEVKYAGYVRRDSTERGRLAERADWVIPPDLAFRGLAGLSAEVQEKLTTARPGTLAEAARISGVTPAALGILAVHLAKHQRTQSVFHVERPHG
jgi:tRNA uridine 5-carboxymethylaminomethyl modification enzyme